MPLFSHHAIEREPVWSTVRRRAPSTAPARLRPWLVDRGSLTQRLIKASDGQFRVQVLQQQIARPRFSEMRLLAMPARGLALVREVVLYGRNQPWVFARSVLPLTSLTGRLSQLRKFDNRPLGDYLFRDPGLRRSAMEIARVHRSNTLLPSGLNQLNAPLWGRRSVFYVDHKPLLISEFFLPTFTPYNRHLEKI